MDESQAMGSVADNERSSRDGDVAGTGAGAGRPSLLARLKQWLRRLKSRDPEDLDIYPLF